MRYYEVSYELAGEPSVSEIFDALWSGYLHLGCEACHVAVDSSDLDKSDLTVSRYPFLDSVPLAGELSATDILKVAHDLAERRDLPIHRTWQNW